MFTPEHWAKKLDPIQLETFKVATEFIVVPQVGDSERDNTGAQNQSLTAMRRQLVQRMNVMVAIGGKRHKTDLSIPGVAEELSLAQKRGMPCFLVGGFGGMASAVAQQYLGEGTVTLNNDLPQAANEALLSTKDVVSCVSIIFDHLARNPSLARRPLIDLRESSQTADSDHRNWKTIALPSADSLIDGPRSTLMVLDFDGIQTADEVLNKLRSLQKEHLIDLEDACVVERGKDGKVHIKQAVNLTALGAARGGSMGALLGTLLGILFLNPLAGMAIGAVAGAL